MAENSDEAELVEIEQEILMTMYGWVRCDKRLKVLLNAPTGPFSGLLIEGLRAAAPAGKDGKCRINIGSGVLSFPAQAPGPTQRVYKVRGTKTENEVRSSFRADWRMSSMEPAERIEALRASTLQELEDSLFKKK